MLPWKPKTVQVYSGGNASDMFQDMPDSNFSLVSSQSLPDTMRMTF